MARGAWRGAGEPGSQVQERAVTMGWRQWRTSRERLTTHPPPSGTPSRGKCGCHSSLRGAAMARGVSTNKKIEEPPMGERVAAHLRSTRRATAPLGETCGGGYQSLGTRSSASAPLSPLFFFLPASVGTAKRIRVGNKQNR